MARYLCPGCGYAYDESRGDPREGWPPGTPWADRPEDWLCPDCGVVERVEFERVDERVEFEGLEFEGADFGTAEPGG